MAEFIEIMRQATRMCEYYEGSWNRGCMQCPLSRDNARCGHSLCLDIGSINDEKAAEIEQVVVDWSSRHHFGNNESGAYVKVTKHCKDSRWISVMDELPEKEGKYIVCTEKGSVYCTRFNGVSGYEGIFACDTNTHITHWMPLPEPPKGEK